MVKKEQWHRNVLLFFLLSPIKKGGDNIKTQEIVSLLHKNGFKEVFGRKGKHRKFSCGCSNLERPIMISKSAATKEITPIQARSILDIIKSHKHS